MKTGPSTCPACDGARFVPGRVIGTAAIFFAPDAGGVGGALGRLFSGPKAAIRAYVCEGCGRMELYQPDMAKGGGA